MELRQGRPFIKTEDLEFATQKSSNDSGSPLILSAVNKNNQDEEDAHSGYTAGGD